MSPDRVSDNRSPPRHLTTLVATEGARVNGTARRVVRRVTAVTVTLMLAASAGAGPEKVAFPADYKSHVLYTSVERPFNDTVREVYASPEAAVAAKAGKPLPSGSVLTMEVYRAKINDQRKP